MTSVFHTPAAAPSEAEPDRPSLRRFWRDARAYWRAGPRCAWPLTLGLLAVVLVSLGITYSLNWWTRHFFDALEAKNASLVLHQAMLFPLLIACHLLLCVFAMAARMTMQRTWRAHLNERLLDRWLSNSRYYRLECVRGDHKNPEHRIHDDLRIATEMPVDFVTGFLTSLLSAVSFFAVLWLVGGAIDLSFGGVMVSIPGYLVCAALLYALLANGGMLLIARGFAPTAARKNQAEAEYRFALTRVRENAESIALMGGDAAERAALGRSFGAVIARWRDLMRQHMRTVIVSQGSAHLCGVVPLLLCAPRFLDGTVTLGQVMQIASAFTIVQGALSWLVDNYTRIAEWTASARRVAVLMSALDDLEKAERTNGAAIARRSEAADALRMCGLSVALPDGTWLVHRLDARVAAGEKILLVGDSGIGKSALVRALSGCWPWGSGEVHHSAGTVTVVPQRPYVPAGSLRDAVAYPRPAEDFAPDDIRDALAAVGLAHFLPQLDHERPWDHTLSLGEKQRLAFARLLVHRPQVILLDEATSALHVAAQAQVLKLIFERLPRAAVMNIGHRPELEAFHRRRLTMQRCPGGARLVADEAIRNHPEPSRGFPEAQAAPPCGVMAEAVPAFIGSARRS